MAEPQPAQRVCPTRTDGRTVLVAHKVSFGQCQDRQRGRYHKCFSCAYNNAYVAKYGLPSPAAQEDAGGNVPPIVEVPEAKPPGVAHAAKVAS